MIILKGNDARNMIIKGCNELNDCMKVTLGPKNRYVCIKTLYDEPFVTNDGFTVAQNIQLDDGEMTGAGFLFDAARETNEKAGDSTTSTVLIANKLINDSLSYINDEFNNANPALIREEIELASQKALAEYDKLKSNDISLVDVATISAKDKEIGKMVAEVMSEDHEVLVEDSQSYETYYEIDGGFKIDKGAVSSYFLVGGKIEYENAKVILVSGKITNHSKFVPILNDAATHNQPVLIIADDFDVQFLGLMISLLQRNHRIVLVKTPGYGNEKEEYIKDISAVTSAQNMTEDSVSEATCGITSFKCDMNKTILIGGDTSKRVEELKQVKTDNDFDKKKLESRISRLSGGIATIYVGGKTEVEQKDRKSRFLDAVSSAKSAKDGVVIGGGVSLMKVSDKLSEDNVGEKLLKEALKAPFIQLCTNSGIDYDSIKHTDGYDFLHNQEVDAIKSGIVDSYKGLRTAIEAAISAAKQAIVLEVLGYYEKKEEKSK